MADVHSVLRQFAVPSDEITLHLTEIIRADDPRAKDPCMKEAINAEVRDLFRRAHSK